MRKNSPTQPDKHTHILTHTHTCTHIYTHSNTCTHIHTHTITQRSRLSLRHWSLRNEYSTLIINNNHFYSVNSYKGKKSIVDWKLQALACVPAVNSCTSFSFLHTGTELYFNRHPDFHTICFDIYASPNVYHGKESMVDWKAVAGTDLCVGSSLELVHHKLLVGFGFDHPLALLHHLLTQQVCPVSHQNNKNPAAFFLSFFLWSWFGLRGPRDPKSNN